MNWKGDAVAAGRTLCPGVFWRVATISPTDRPPSTFSVNCPSLKPAVTGTAVNSPFSERQTCAALPDWPEGPGPSAVEGPGLSEVEGPGLSAVEGPGLSEVEGPGP